MENKIVRSPFELKHEIFENGFAFIGAEVKETETIAILGSVKAGTISDVPEKSGRAELTSRLLMRGSKEHTASQLSQRIEEAGATLSFDNRDESVSFSARCHHSVLEEVLSTIAECVNQPAFPAEEIGIAKNEIITDIKSEEDDTRSTAYRQIMALLYGADFPYGRNPLGNPKSIQGLTREDLKAFHEENYGPQKMVLAMTGRFDFEEVRSRLGKFFSDGIPSRREFVFSEPSLLPNGLDVSDMEHKTQVDVALGSRAVPRKSDSYYSLNLGNLVLGRLGLYGRLGKNVREKKGIAYYCFSLLQAKLFSGNLGIFAGVNPKNIEAAIEGITEEIGRITTERITDDELEAAKRNALGSLSISLDSSNERVGILHDIEYFGLGLDYLDRYPGLVGSVTSEAILRDFEKYLNPDRISVAAAGPIGKSSLRLPKEILRKGA
jgi:zinc protease